MRITCSYSSTSAFFSFSFLALAIMAKYCSSGSEGVPLAAKNLKNKPLTYVCAVNRASSLMTTSNVEGGMFRLPVRVDTSKRSLKVDKAPV